MVADLVEGLNDGLRCDRISNAGTGHAVRLGERAHAHCTRVLGVDIHLHRVRRELYVRLVVHQQAVLGQRRHEAADSVCIVPGAHGIVRIGEINECSMVLVGRFSDSVQIDVIVAVGHSVEGAAEAIDMVVERWIRAE